jgi:hypothetical protein
MPRLILIVDCGILILYERECGDVPCQGHQKEGMMKSIPCHGYYALGQMVKLTLNIVPELGLFNGARGTVRDIVYPDGGGYVPACSANSVVPHIIVEFAGYTGPCLFDAATIVRLEDDATHAGIDLRKLVAWVFKKNPTRQ